MYLVGFLSKLLCRQRFGFCPLLCLQPSRGSPSWLIIGIRRTIPLMCRWAWGQTAGRNSSGSAGAAATWLSCKCRPAIKPAPGSIVSTVTVRNPCPKGSSQHHPMQHWQTACCAMCVGCSTSSLKPRCLVALLARLTSACCWCPEQQAQSIGVWRLMWMESST